MHAPDIDRHDNALFRVVGRQHGIQIAQPQRRHLADIARHHHGRRVARFECAVGRMIGGGILGRRGPILDRDIRFIAHNPNGARILLRLRATRPV